MSKEFAIFPVRFYPFPMTEKEHVGVSRPFSLKAFEQTVGIVAVPQRIFNANEIKGENDLLKVGVLIEEWKKTKEDNNSWWVRLSFGAPVEFKRIWFDETAGCFKGEGEIIHLYPSISDEPDFTLIHACQQILGYFANNDFFDLIPTLRALIQKAYSWTKSTHPISFSSKPEDQERIVKIIVSILETGEVSFYLLPDEYKKMLTARTVKDFVLAVWEFVQKLDKRIEDLKKIRNQADEIVAKHSRIAYLTSLREAINAELKEITQTTGDPEVDELLRTIEENPNLPADLKAKLREELEAIAGPTQNPERPITVRHVQFVLSLPWGKFVEPNTNFDEIRRSLEDSHYGLNDVKERILEYIALYTHLKRPPKGNILCFIGPPGTGKTSMAAAIAEALKLPFCRISLGSVSDEAEIKGHRRTYIGAMPGRIAAALAQIKALNGIIFLDEIDKMGVSYKGRPDAALLDVLDPDRNFEFLDHYVDYPIDLSNVLFICGANVQENINPILADRMEFIHFSGYIYPEKFQIAKYYLVPKIKKNWEIDDIQITDEAISYAVKTWGRWEMGVREVKRQLESAFRKALGLGEKRITAKFLREHFPPPTPTVEWQNEYVNKVGYVPVAAVNRSGEGTICWLEIHKVKFEGETKGWNLEIIGSADESMKESAKSAFLWCYHHIPEIQSSQYKWIIYLPSVSIPRQGPSASLAIAVGIICTHLNRPIGKPVAMTGELSASGKILPVGGIPSKVIAAENAGMEEIFIPAANKSEFDFWLKKRKMSLKIKVTPVETIDEVLKKLGIEIAIVKNSQTQGNSPLAKLLAEG